jgi:REP element-mobilizing transposase RayT
VQGRKLIRLPARNYVGRNTYFLTACTLRRDCIFSNPRWADLVAQSFLRAAKAEEFLLHAWCVMPDHVHVLAEGMAEASHMARFVGYWKRSTTFEFKKVAGRELWQRLFYDRVLRDSDSRADVAWYIWLNPVRKGMCREPRDYAWSGSMTDLRMNSTPSEIAWIPPWKQRKKEATTAETATAKTGPNTGRG